MTNKEKIGAKKESATPAKENFISKTIVFFNKYNKIVYGVVIGILIIVLGLIGFNRFYLTPKTEKASMLILKPIDKLLLGDSVSIQLALEGDDEMDGFISIANSYSLTKTANTANYYAGVCYLKLNNPDEALVYLKKYKHKEDALWYACQSLIGDIYDDMGDTKKAIEYYEKSIDGNDDPYFTPANQFKLAQMYERDEQWQKALDIYTQIEKDFYDQYQSMGLARFADRVAAKLGK
jgi:tetratricopeptide (TPR) repeat protein